MRDFEVGDMVEYRGDGDRGIVVGFRRNKHDEPLAVVMWTVWTAGGKVSHNVRSEETFECIDLLSGVSNQ